MEEQKINKEALFYDRKLLFNHIKEFPQTYQTLTFGLERKTLEIIARRKLNAMCEDGEICKCIIPGTRFGQVMFYTHDRKYTIIIEAARIGVDIYCFFDFKKDGVFRYNVEHYWMLDGKQWKEYNKFKSIFLGNVLKII